MAYQLEYGHQDRGYAGQAAHQPHPKAQHPPPQQYDSYPQQQQQQQNNGYGYDNYSQGYQQSYDAGHDQGYDQGYGNPQDYQGQGYQASQYARGPPPQSPVDQYGQQPPSRGRGNPGPPGRGMEGADGRGRGGPDGYRGGGGGPGRGQPPVDSRGRGPPRGPPNRGPSRPEQHSTSHHGSSAPRDRAGRDGRHGPGGTGAPKERRGGRPHDDYGQDHNGMAGQMANMKLNGHGQSPPNRGQGSQGYFNPNPQGHGRRPPDGGYSGYDDGFNTPAPRSADREQFSPPSRGMTMSNQESTRNHTDNMPPPPRRVGTEPIYNSAGRSSQERPSPGTEHRPPPHRTYPQDTQGYSQNQYGAAYSGYQQQDRDAYGGTTDPYYSDAQQPEQARNSVPNFDAAPPNASRGSFEQSMRPPVGYQQAQPGAHQTPQLNHAKSQPDLRQPQAAVFEMAGDIPDLPPVPQNHAYDSGYEQQGYGQSYPQSQGGYDQRPPVSAPPTTSPGGYDQRSQVSAPPTTGPGGYDQRPQMSAPPTIGPGGYDQGPPVSATPTPGGYDQRPPMNANPTPRPGGYGQRPPVTANSTPAPGGYNGPPRGAAMMHPSPSQDQRNPDGLPSHPTPVRPGLMSNSTVNSRERPPPVRNYTGVSQASSAPVSQVSAPPPAQRPQAAPPAKQLEEPVTGQELEHLRMAIKNNPNDQQSALKLAKRLAEAADVLVPTLPDPKSRARARERYVMDAQKILKKLANSQNPEAMFFLADCLGRGLFGNQPDPKEAFALYHSSAKLGHGAAAYRTAVCCEIGQDEGGGTRKDPLKAVQWYKRAAVLGDPPGMYKMGMIGLKGLLGQPRNTREAVGWLKRAADVADAENPHALHELGLLYESAQPNDAIIHDARYALSLFQQAADLGYKFSQFRLGCAFEYGLMGCPIDPRQSIRWYSQAAQKEEHQSELALSGWYLTGSEGVLGQSDTEAYLWARKAAMAGLAKAEYAMGYFTEVGIGVPPNLEDAKRWYWRAAAQDMPKARERLEDLKRAGRNVGPRQRERISRSRIERQQEGDCSVM